MDTGVIGSDWDLHCAGDRRTESFPCLHLVRHLLCSQIFVVTPLYFSCRCSVSYSLVAHAQLCVIIFLPAPLLSA